MENSMIDPPDYYDDYDRGGQYYEVPEEYDVHTLTAAAIMGIDPGDVTPEQRRAAKAVNFGRMYGKDEAA